MFSLDNLWLHLLNLHISGLGLSCSSMTRTPWRTTVQKSTSGLDPAGKEIFFFSVSSLVERLFRCRIGSGYGQKCWTFPDPNLQCNIGADDPDQGFSAFLVSVVDPGCLSRILIFSHPGSRIPDPKTATKERGEKKLVFIPFYVATNLQNFKLI